MAEWLGIMGWQNLANLGYNKYVFLINCKIVSISNLLL